MRFNGNNVIAQAWRICLLMLLTLPVGTMTSQIQQIHIKPVRNKRLNVAARDVITRSSAIKCESTCRQTSWCTSANMAPDRSTCHLLSEEVSDVGSLEEAHGWSYLRKYRTSKSCNNKIWKISASDPCESLRAHVDV